MFACLPDGARRLLKIRTKRAAPQPGPRPQPGAYLVYGHVRMIVQTGFDDELWDWLQQRGWRESDFHPDRRNYREAPLSSMEDLIDVPAELRSLVLRDLLARASFAPPFLESTT